MDPNKNLDELRQLVRDIQGRGLSTSTILQKTDQITNLFSALDEWIVKGGFLPSRWSGRGPPITMPFGPLDDMEKELLASGRYIEAVRNYYRRTGCDLRQAKNAIDEYRMRNLNIRKG